MRVQDPKNITQQDLARLFHVQRTGFVRIDPDGNGYCEDGGRITGGRLERLRNLGLLEPSGDALFSGAPSQTWRLTDGAKAGVKGGPAVGRDQD